MPSRAALQHLVAPNHLPSGRHGYRSISRLNSLRKARKVASPKDYGAALAGWVMALKGSSGPIGGCDVEIEPGIGR